MTGVVRVRARSASWIVLTLFATCGSNVWLGSALRGAHRLGWGRREHFVIASANISAAGSFHDGRRVHGAVTRPGRL
jgi:hypothetical protein